jgi:ferredoxin-NADP reductase
MKIIRAVDRLSMYRFVLVALVVLAVYALAVAASGTDFAYTAGELLGSLAILVVVCAAVTYACAAIVRVPPGSESWLITALILFFIFPGLTDSDTGWGLVLAAAIASASKYVVAVRRRHIVNPAVAGAVVSYFFAYFSIGSFAYPIWWIAAEPLLIPMILIGVAVVWKLREWWIVGTFIVVATITMIIVAVDKSTPIGDALELGFKSTPLLFVAAIMLTEPLTSPATRIHGLIYAALIGVLMYCGLKFEITSDYTLAFVPEIALLAGSVYTFIVGRQWRRTRLTVESVQPIGTGTYEVLASPALRFRAGQWAQISDPTWSPAPEKQGTRRVLSLAGAPGEGSTRFGFTVGGQPSEFKRRLIEQGVGRQLYVDEIGGDFTLPRNVNTPIVFIAGGIGITPFRSMLADLTARADADLTRVSLIYAANSEDRLVYTDVLDAARARGAQVITVVGGLVSADEIASVVRPGAHYYLSGPPMMLAALKPMLIRAEPAVRWQPWRLHTDRFIGY